ncbi:MAG: FAD-binding protein [Solirubrobacterales bacterium]|nr:FAD-binding protein [Solirubrobacterales bacterium]
MTTEWVNWSGGQSCRPAERVRPSGRGELAEVVASAAGAGRQITVPGSGHSFTATALTEDLMVDIGALSGVLAADRSSGLVKVGGGTVLADLNRGLDSLGLAMANLGDIDRQTIAGAISTATHGTGAGFGNIPAQVAEIELMGPDGVVRTFGPEDGDRFRAARVGVGALGIITAVTLRTVPAFDLHRVDEPMDLDDVLSNFHELAAGNDHFEFFVFPRTTRPLVIRRNRTDRARAPRHPVERFLGDVVIENGLGDLALRTVGKFPGMIPQLARFSTAFMSQAEQVDVSHRVFANFRTIRFEEMEYALPREAGPEALSRVLALIEGENFPIAMPIECRVVAADDALLSPTSERDATYIAVHQHRGQEWRPYFAAIEEIFAEHGGRPHWGKRHTRDAVALAALYPGWDRFAGVRDELDPERTFTNGYVSRVLGP